MTLTPAIMIFVAILLAATAVAALVWAIRSHQFRDFTAGARSIFDEEEPIGEMTDAFPGEAAPGPPDETRGERARRREAAS